MTSIYPRRGRTALPAFFLLAAAFALGGCSRQGATSSEGSAVAPAVLEANAAMAKSLKLDDPKDFEDAKKGLIAKPSGKLMAADGTVLKDYDAYPYLQDNKPADTVNPSLWRHAQLNSNIGLFKVTEGVYQLRGFDMANMTLIEGKTGWIVVDTLTSRESAAFALEFARKHLGNKPVSAVVLTHAHIDHFGGVLGVVSAKEVEERKIPVVAPAGFMEEATSENVMMDAAMGRRAMYQFGKNLPLTVKGNVDTGLGKDQVWGNFGVLAPNWLILKPTQQMRLDGVDFVFHNVPNAECPAELTFSIPDLKLYDGAENLAQTMHNLLPIRGAKVRDALRWSNYMDQAMEQMDGIDIYIGSHNWPIWGNANIREFITKHRDVYKYTHDQTVRLANAGYTPREIADMVKLPESLSSYMGTRGYYGDLRHNVKAVYQFYLGLYDGNPANLNPLPPAQSAKRYVELMGGADKVVAAGQSAYDKGEYRWAAELLNQAVYADAGNKAAKELLAKTYDQMGYMSEAASWRNSYLTAAMELRDGAPAKGLSKAMAIDMLQQVPTERFLEKMAASLKGPDAEGKNLKINLVLTDQKESYVLWIENAVMHFKSAPPAADANATLTLTRNILVKMIAGTAGAKDTLLSDDLNITGSKIDLVRFFSLIEKAEGNHAILTR